MHTSDVVFLILGVAIIVTAGRLLAYSGRRYVGGSSSRDGGSADSIAILVAVVFHLCTLGLLALISVLPVGSNQTQAFMIRLGVFLLVLGAIYGITLMMLARRREAAVVEAKLSANRQPQDQVPQQASAFDHPQDPSAGSVNPTQSY
ncbi:MAG: hypothetical protein ACRDRL_14445 [Sciscionella sp.]